MKYRNISFEIYVYGLFPRNESEQSPESFSLYIAGYIVVSLLLAKEYRQNIEEILIRLQDLLRYLVEIFQLDLNKIKNSR